MKQATSPPVLWSQEWALEKAAQAMRYLAENYPECGGLEALGPYHDAVHEAAVAEDRGAYKEALREYMRAGRREALTIRRGTACAKKSPHLWRIFHYVMKSHYGVTIQPVQTPGLFLPEPQTYVCI